MTFDVQKYKIKQININNKQTNKHENFTKNNWKSKDSSFFSRRGKIVVNVVLIKKKKIHSY